MTVDPQATARRFLDRIEAATSAARYCDPIRTVLLTPAEAAEFTRSMELVGGGVLGGVAGGEPPERSVESHLFALGLDLVSTHGDGRPLGVLRGVVLAERVAAEEVIDEGVRAVLVACRMLQRIGERLQQERAMVAIAARQRAVSADDAEIELAIAGLHVADPEQRVERAREVVAMRAMLQEAPCG